MPLFALILWLCAGVATWLIDVAEMRTYRQGPLWFELWLALVFWPMILPCIFFSLTCTPLPRAQDE